MRKITFLFAAAVVFMAACNNSTEHADAKADSTSGNAVKGTKAPAAMPDSATMAKAREAFMTPGEMHKWMEKTNGNWEADITLWTAPGVPPSKTKGSMTQSSIMGGRYVTGKFTATMMGMPMEGMSTMGYDNGKKQFVSTWIDNFGTGIVYMTGTYDSTTKTLNMKGVQTDPVSGKDSNIREEVTTIDNDSYTQYMFGDGPDGKEMKFMEAVYKRRK